MQFEKAYLHTPIKDATFSHTRKNSKMFNPNLDGGGGGGGVILPTPLYWFSLNNSETVKAVTLAYCCIL